MFKWQDERGSYLTVSHRTIIRWNLMNDKWSRLGRPWLKNCQKRNHDLSRHHTKQTLRQDGTQSTVSNNNLRENGKIWCEFKLPMLRLYPPTNVRPNCSFEREFRKSQFSSSRRRMVMDPGTGEITVLYCTSVMCNGHPMLLFARLSQSSDEVLKAHSLHTFSLEGRSKATGDITAFSWPIRLPVLEFYGHCNKAADYESTWRLPLPSSGQRLLRSDQRQQVILHVQHVPTDQHTIRGQHHQHRHWGMSHTLICKICQDVVVSPSQDATFASLQRVKMAPLTERDAEGGCCLNCHANRINFLVVWRERNFSSSSIIQVPALPCGLKSGAWRGQKVSCSGIPISEHPQCKFPLVINHQTPNSSALIFASTTWAPSVSE